MFLQKLANFSAIPVDNHSEVDYFVAKTLTPFRLQTRKTTAYPNGTYMIPSGTAVTTNLQHAYMYTKDLILVLDKSVEVAITPAGGRVVTYPAPVGLEEKTKYLRQKGMSE